MKLPEKLLEISKKIEELYPKYIEEKEKYNTFMVKYSRREAQATTLDTTMGLKNAEQRSAEILKILDCEKLIDKKLEISNNYYRIKIELDFLQELSSNLRAIIYSNKE